MTSYTKSTTITQKERETSTTFEGVTTTTKVSTGSIIKRSSKGAIAFKSVHPRGANIIIENVTSGAGEKSQSLKGWYVQRSEAGSAATDIPLKDFVLEPRAIYTIWAKGAKDKATADNEQVSDEVSLCHGSYTLTLLDEAGNDMYLLHMSLEEAVRLAQDREAYRVAVRTTFCTGQVTQKKKMGHVTKKAVCDNNVL